MTIYRKRMAGVRGLGDADEWMGVGASGASDWIIDGYGDLVPAGGGGGGIADSGIFGSGISVDQAVNAIKTLWLSGQQAEAQQRIIDMNMARARAGLNPLPATYFQPQAQVNVGVSPQIMKLAIGVGAGIGLWALINSLKKK